MNTNLPLLLKASSTKWVEIFCKVKLFTLVFVLNTWCLSQSNLTADSGQDKSPPVNTNITDKIDQKILDSLRDEDLEILSNINCNLTNAWTINVKINDPEDNYNSNAIKTYLFTYKTRKDGRNSGVIMDLYDIKYKDTVLIDKKPNHSSIKAHFFYTKNYIVYINHGVAVNMIYDSYMPILIEELKTFFKENEENL